MSNADEEGRLMEQQLEEYEAYLAKCEAEGVCWASGLKIKRCMASICDCFRESHPDSPYDLHPEDFVVRPAPEQGRD